ncbi:MAG: T9SS type A sorting domain-containing protein [Saprospiraceae bacterium]|nr:T9SS type A sorting domain-containing protein [Saprospiraceae bacterium]
MKFHLLVCSILLGLQLSNLNARPDHQCSDTLFLPFVTAQNEWIVDWKHPSPGWPSEIRRYTFSADSALKDGKYYHELIYSTNMSSGPWISDARFYREENGRTYRWMENSPEQLIYDFNFVVGDSLPGVDPNQAIRYVVQIDTETLLDGIPRKSVIFNSVCGPFRWVEGIGEMEDFLDSETFCSLWDGIPMSIRCFSTNGQLLYIRPGLSTCYASSTNNLTTRPVKAYPNPASDFLALELDQNEPLQHLKLYNALGALVLSTGNCENNRVVLPALTPGLYFGSARFSDGSEGWFRVMCIK